MTDRAARRRDQRFGHTAESACCWLLRSRGYRILARRWRSRAGEIDIVARRGNLLAFIEVKARRSLETAAESVSIRQRDRIARAAALFVRDRPRLAGCDWRFDAMLVARWRAPVHVIDAWRPDGGTAR